jgi:hypothetical protein
MTNDSLIPLSIDAQTLPPSPAARIRARTLLEQLEGLSDLPIRFPRRATPIVRK